MERTVGGGGNCQQWHGRLMNMMMMNFEIKHSFFMKNLAQRVGLKVS